MERDHRSCRRGGRSHSRCLVMSADSRGGLVTFGETMGLISATEIGPLATVHRCRFGIGGAESNVAIGVRRLGQPAAWWGRVGRDATGDMIRQRLTAEGVTTVAIPGSEPTGLMVRTERFAQVTRIDYHRHASAGSRLAPIDIPRHLIDGAALLHITGITPALSATASATVFAAIDMARSAGLVISLDVNYRRKLWSREAAAPVLHQLTRLADIVFAGPDEASLVLGAKSVFGAASREDSIELAHQLAALGPTEVIIKSGARGAVALMDGQTLRRAAVEVPVVDTVGAGDAFVAGYLAERLGGMSPAARLDTAVRAGALAVSVPGDCEGLPRREELSMAADAQEVER